MCLCHKFGIQADIALCMIHCLPAGLVNGIHNYFVKLGSINTGLTLDAARLCVTSGNGAIVEKQHLGISLQTDLFRTVNRHIGNNGSGRILCHLICFFQGIYFYDIVAVESALNDRTCLAETGLASADLGNRVIRFC